MHHVQAGAVSNLPFSSAVVVGDFIFVSGQASVDPETGAIVPDEFAGEMRRSFDNLQRILHAADSDLTQLVSVRCYLDRQERLEEYNRVYRELLSSPFPARTTLVGVLGTGIVKFEVDAIARRLDSTQTAK